MPLFEVSERHGAHDVVCPVEAPVGAGDLHLGVGPVDVLHHLTPLDADVLLLLANEDELCRFYRSYITNELTAMSWSILLTKEE